MFIPFLMLGLLSYYFRLASTDVERKMTEIAQTDALTGFQPPTHGGALDEEVARFRARGTTSR